MTTGWLHLAGSLSLHLRLMRWTGREIRRPSRCRSRGGIDGAGSSLGRGIECGFIDNISLSHLIPENTEVDSAESKMAPRSWYPEDSQPGV